MGIRRGGGRFSGPGLCLYLEWLHRVRDIELLGTLAPRREARAGLKGLRPALLPAEGERELREGGQIRRFFQKQRTDFGNCQLSDRWNPFSIYLSFHSFTQQLIMDPIRSPRSKVVKIEIITSGSGKPFQSFDILHGHIDETTIWVDENSVLSERKRKALEKYRIVQKKSDEFGSITEFWLEWKPVKDFSESGPNDAHFTVVENSDNSSTVIFGDGQNGRVLPVGQDNIRIQYSSGLGICGNVPDRKIPKVSGAGTSSTKVSNPQPSSGGADPEPADEPRHRTPQTLKNHRQIVFPRNVPHVLEKRVLRPEVNVKLQEICNSIKKQRLVHSHLVSGTRPKPKIKLCILFSGPSETPKIIAAIKIARESGLDLFRIDMSSVVSKYIGETEKNLSIIFSEADTSNAILFFDEADALFGRRTPVRDAHDRYANIEVTYLLQKMEEFEGLAILASNNPGNSNKDFQERMDFVVDFP